MVIRPARSGLLAAAIFISTFLATASRAAASPILDQSYAVSSSSALIYDITDWAQTFTPGLSGLLTQVDLFLNDGLFREPVDPLNVSIFSVVGGLPGASLGSLSVLPAATTDSYSWLALDTTALNLFVTAGTPLAILLQSSTPYDMRYFWGHGGTGYAGGTAMYRQNSSPWTQRTDQDLNFRTYVDPTAVAAVPEPASLLLLGTGLAFAAAKARRRKQQANKQLS